MKARIFQRPDWLCGALAALVAFGVYAWTTAPSVTLLDSGEFLVAAQHFGVPHPTGYPLWTLLAWLFHFLPFGNVAWQIALFSGVCGALAVGLAAMLIRNGALWILPAADPGVRNIASICAISFALAFAFSFSMWSQAVIVEVYTLHALLIGLYLTSLYVWLRRPEKMAGVYWSFFTFSLAFSNHQLTLALAPLPFLAVLLVRRDLFWDLLLAVTVCVLIAYLSFAMLSDDPLVLKAAIRLGFLVIAVLAIALFLKRGRLQWKLTVGLPFVLCLGMLPYVYLPLASATNPPMNWGYTRTSDGFFSSFNRSQYTGTLSELSLRVLTKVLGVLEPAAKDDSQPKLDDLRDWTGFFLLKILHDFTPLALLFLLAAFAGAVGGPPPARAWIYLLIAAFALATILQPVLEHARTDNNGWWLQMPYHTYTNFIFAVLGGIGACFTALWIAKRLPAMRHGAWALLLLPLWPVYWNAANVSQRDHWFGWQYGRDMLTNLPKGSVLFGGTDPGRFIPTYLILGESTLPPHRRIDPKFDRRDLYILTQNALSDRYYLAYIRDQYSTDRPRVKNAFERWLGRDRAYPEEPLILPTLEEMQQIREEGAREARATVPPLTPVEVYRVALAAISQWIFEKNKAGHTFFVEQGFRMSWSYDYAIPEGLLYRLNPEPMTQLPEGAAGKDLAFWNDYIARLKTTPTYKHDYDAQRSFSELRITGGNIYEYRRMFPEAERAYRQALELWSGNTDAIVGLSRILWKRGQFDEVIAMLDRALVDDPNSRQIRTTREKAVRRKESQAEIETLLGKWRATPQDIATLEKVVTLYAQIGEPEKVDSTLVEAIEKVGREPAFLALVVKVSEAQGKWQQSLDASSRWTNAAPKSVEAWYLLARAQLALGLREECVTSLQVAVDLGGIGVRERLFTDRFFKSLKDTPAFQRLMAAPPPSANLEKNSGP